MRKLKAWNLMSLDGYFEGTTPWSLDFHGSVWGPELEAFSLAQLAEIGTLLFGRRTYEGMADYWQKETGAIADAMNGIEKAVASRTLAAADWTNTRLLRGEAAETVKALKQEDGKDIFVFGSADLLATLLEHRLVDEYRLCLAPVVLGAGTPLFKPPHAIDAMTLVDASALASGGVMLRYALPAS